MNITYPVGKVEAGHCLWCGKLAPEPTGTSPRKWCSSKCSQEAAYYRKKNGLTISPTTNCVYCGLAIEKSGPRQYKRKFCNDSCRIRNYRRENTEWKAKAREAQRKRRKTKPDYIKLRGPYGTCQKCGEVMVSFYGRFCGRPACRAKARRAVTQLSKICSMEGCTSRAEARGMCGSHYASEWARLNPERKRAHNSARRARRIGASVAGDIFTRLDILNRDMWRCHICGGTIPEDATYPSPEYGTVDHVIPLIHGGAHSSENVKAAHSLCNSKKGDSLGVERVSFTS